MRTTSLEHADLLVSNDNLLYSVLLLRKNENINKVNLKYCSNMSLIF